MPVIGGTLERFVRGLNDDGDGTPAPVPVTGDAGGGVTGDTSTDSPGFGNKITDKLMEELNKLPRKL